MSGPGLLLAACVRNSQTALGLVRDGEVEADWRVSTAEARTADEWSVLLRGLLGEREEELEGVVVAATVPSVLQEWRAMLAGPLAGLRHVIVEPGVRTGLPVLTDQPREVGTDRIVNALAASAAYGGPVVVVDIGTATTFDVVNSNGQYVGGAISPGIEISLAALERHGAQLRMVELRRPRSAIARNTVEALQSGMIFGFASMVDGIVERMITELDSAESVPVVATGHLAPLVFDECRCFTAHEPWLTLRGLELVYRRNS
ncbi:MAG: type III pantothenate kinase [Nocardioides sp.]